MDKHEKQREAEMLIRDRMIVDGQTRRQEQGGDEPKVEQKEEFGLKP